MTNFNPHPLFPFPFNTYIYYTQYLSIEGASLPISGYDISQHPPPPLFPFPFNTYIYYTQYHENELYIPHLYITNVTTRHESDSCGSPGGITSINNWPQHISTCKER